MHALTHSSRRYLLAQCAFWSTYGVFNIAMFGLFVKLNALTWLIGLSLPLLLALGTHILRALYKTYALPWSIGRVVVHAMWAVPLLAISVQFLLHWAIRACLTVYPELAQGMQTQGMANIVVYSLNTMVILALWITGYLTVDQFTRRRASELAHWKTQAKLHEAELHFLRSQMNSHFIFNALNNVRALIRENPELARERLTQLATLLRAILQAEQRDKVPLHDELEIVRGYLALESLQFEERLHIQWDVDTEAEHMQLPLLAIQTLVENAIKHGIAGRREGGAIHIAAHGKDHRLCVVITNPIAESKSTVESHGIGLKNTRARLLRLFGERASVEINTAQNHVVTIMEIPQ